MGDLLDGIMSSMDKDKPKSSQTSASTSTSFRIPRRNKDDQQDVQMDNRERMDIPSRSHPPSVFKRNRSPDNELNPDVKRGKCMDTFNTINCIPVQTNGYSLIIDNMVEKIERFQVDIYAVLKSRNETREPKVIQVNGEILVHGDLAIQYRKWGLWNSWKLAVAEKPNLFSGKTYKGAAYDCGASFWVPAGTYVGGDEEIVTLKREKFDDKAWSPIAKLSKSEISCLNVMITRQKQGCIYTRGPHSTSAENAFELNRFLETLTSQVTMSREFFQFGNATFNRKSDRDQNGDVDRFCQLDSDGKEIKTGFEKSMRMVMGVDGKQEFVMTIDTRRSPFYQEMDVIDMVRVLYDSGRGHQGGGFRGGRGGHGGRGGYNDRGGRGGYNDRPVERISIRDVNDQMRRDGASQTRKRLSELRSLAVCPTHLPHTKLNLFFIHDFAEQNAHELKFADDSGSEISVYEYFLKKYSIRLRYPELPLAIHKLGQRVNCYPMEVLKIERGQRVKQNNITPSIQQIMTGKMSMLPEKHINLAAKILYDYLQIDNNLFLQAFGLEINRKPVQMIAKILPAPVIHFAKNRSVEIQTGTNKRPNFNPAGTFFRAAELRDIWIINFDQAMRRDGCDRLCDAISNACKDQNVRISKRSRDWKIVDCNESDHRKLEDIMRDAKSREVSMVFAVTRDQRPDVHDFLKMYESQIGIQTQHISFNTFKKMTENTGGRQTTDNVIRKFNLKGGGLNFTFSIPRTVHSKQLCENEKTVQNMLMENTLFIGFELSHAGATCLFDRQNNIACGEPSVVGYSYSLRNPCDLGGYSYLQKPREHTLQNIQKHMAKILTNYELVNKNLPEKVVIYRSGMGEGDFERVEEEVRQMKLIFESKKEFVGKKIPEFVMIVVSKTSHIRIYPQKFDPRGKSFDQNVPSGTCISGGITGYGREEFILASQSALIGTIRPARYTIVVNDPKWSVNEISHLTYFLAFGHQVSFQPPGVPNVLYAAENMAKRGRNTFVAHQKSLKLERAVNKNDAQEDESGELIDQLSQMLNACAIQNKNYWA